MTESQDHGTPKGGAGKKRHIVSPLEEGIALARAGDRAGARAIFQRIIHENPHQEDAWLWLSWVAEDKAKSRAYLREAEALLEPSERLEQAMAWAEQQAGGPADPNTRGMRPEKARAPGDNGMEKQPPRPTAGRMDRGREAGGPTAPPNSPPPLAPRTRHAAAWAKALNLGEKNAEREVTPASPGAAPAATPVVGRGRPSSAAPRLAGQFLEGVIRRAGHISGPWAQRSRSQQGSPQGPDLRWQQVQRGVLPVLSIIALVVVILFAGAMITNVRERSSTVRAMTLPTPVADAAPTPALQQRLDSLWRQINVAFEQENWESAIPALERYRELNPRSEEARTLLSQAYVQLGAGLVAASKLGEAQELFDKAVRLDAGSEQLQEARHRLALYLSGLEAYVAQKPEQVIESLEPLYAKDPNYRDTTVMLGQAHFKMAEACQEKGEWEKARDHLKTALQCVPNMPDAESRLAAVEAQITPPKRVVVDLSEQMMTVYQDNQPIHIFTVCTGRASAPTVPGRYTVLDKMPMAYASTWNLDMPWWVGIYWAGGSENGFHALPLRHGGKQVLWSNSLGRPCSFGCIVLDSDDAITFYEWIEVGTVIFVNY